MRFSIAMTVALTVAALTSAGCDTAGQGVIGNLPAPVFNDPDRLPAVQPAGPVHNVSITTSTRRMPTSRRPQPRGPRVSYDPQWRRHATARDWKYIVVHHSATAEGGAVRFDKSHRGKGWDELGYHFVIGNGTDSGDGVIEAGSRWVKQKHGAHCKTNDQRFNQNGIGICLVGNFQRSGPSSAQMASLKKLIRFLMVYYDIPAKHVFGHGEAVATVNEGRATDCPGNHLSMPAIRRFAQTVEAAGYQK